MRNSDLPADVVWRIYHLMRGGIDESQPMRLAALAGVSAFDLQRINLANLFNWAHRQWGGLSWEDAAAPVAETTPALPQRLLAKCGEQVVCDNCGRICAKVPCLNCPHGTTPKWIAERHKRPVNLQIRTAARELLGEGTHPSVRTQLQYHGNCRDDV